MDGLTRRCHICRKERPDAFISVRKNDTSKKFMLPEGTMISNIRYCNDNEGCVEKSKSYTFFKEN